MTGRHAQRGLVGVLALAALGTVAVAPLAVSSGPASATKIDGARSINDRVEVQVRKPKNRTTDVHLLAYNDFHGNLEPGALNIYGQFAGGGAYLSKAIKDREALYGDKAVTVMAGDNIGASPLANSLFYEEPATIATSLMGTDFASVGNHEFDKGAAELLRVAGGGCRADVGCTGAPYALPDGGTTDTYPGASFQYLSANVVDSETGETLFPAYGTVRIKSDSGKKFTVGFIGEVLEETPTIVTPAGVAGLDFLDEAEAANAAAADLKARGVDTIVLLIHQGGSQTTGAALNGCVGNLAGSPIETIVQDLDPSIAVIVSGHTHAEYRCTITHGGTTRLVTSASSFGRVLSDITLTIDDKTGELVAMAAENVIVANALNAPGPGVVRAPDPSKEDPEVAAVVQQYVTASAPLANQVVGEITADITRTATALGETSLGNLIADAQLAATAPAGFGDAVIAFMNPGGVRADLVHSQISGGEAPGEVTYGEAFTVQPFGNSLVTKTMTGAQIRALLEQQFVGCGGATIKRILQISTGFSYDQTPEAATCADRIGAVTLNGTPLDPAASYRVTMNSFLATGGDAFTVFNQGTDPLGGAVDLDALLDYLEVSGVIAPPPTDRIT